MRAIASSVFSTPGRRNVWLAALALVATIGSVAVVYHRRYVASLEAVHQTLEVQEAIDETLSLLKDAETGQRGYVLTGYEEFLAPYDDAVRALPVQLQALADLVQNDREQKASSRKIEQLAHYKMDELEQTVDLRRTGRTEDALTVVREGRGRRMMVSLRSEADRMRAREDARLAERDQEADLGRRRLSAVLGGVWGFFFFMVTSGLWFANRGVAEAKRANVRLKESEKALRTVADNATDLVRILDENSNNLYVSPSCEAILGYSREEVLGMGPRTLLPEEEREAALALTTRIRSGDPGKEPFIHRLRTRAGNYRWFETTYCLVREGSLETEHIYLTSRDVTERRRVEESLRRQTARLESVLSSMGDGVVVLDENRRFLMINPSARQFVRQEEGERAEADWPQRHQTYMLDGKTLFPADQGPLTRALRGEQCSGVELLIYDRNEVPRIFSVTAHPIRDGSIAAGCVAVYRDISEQRRAEQAVAESEHRLRVLSESSFEGIAITKDGVILDANENFASWVGKKPADLIGTPGVECFAPGDREQARMNSLVPDLCYESNLLREDGTHLPVEVRGRYTTFRGQSVRIAVIRDITEKRERQAESKAKEELLRTLSLRDELTTLYNRRGFLELAQQSLRAAVRSRLPACVFFADLNGMKKINDALGHEAGDRAIVATGKLLSTVFRASDIVARLGGDEFAIFAVDCRAADLPAVRRRLKAHFDEWNRSTSEPFQLSISIGEAMFDPNEPIELNKLMENADRAMYQEKRGRRGAVGPRQSSDPDLAERPASKGQHRLA